MNKTTANAIQKTAQDIANTRRKQSLQKRKDFVMGLPDCPPLLSLNELANKTRLPYKFLRHLIIEQNKIPYLKIKCKVLYKLSAFSQLHGRVKLTGGGNNDRT